MFTFDTSFIQNSGLVHYWPIWGDTNDLVGGMHLKNGSNVSFTYDRFGYEKSALFLNDGFYVLPQGVYFNSSFTFSVWIKVHETREANKLFELCDSSDCNGKERVVFGISSGLNATVYFKTVRNTNDSFPTINSASLLATKKWTFLTFVLNDTFGTIYINGTKDGQGQSYVPQNMIRYSNYLGRGHWDTNRNVYADLDEIRIYNRALSQTEVIDLMNNNLSYIKNLN